ncbi:MAG TPA: glycoside hydrolase family 44 protein [Anaeromyxobacter sp.]|nr:glycoside hydrolase family 44 protein [Anaeromyxobacter sp.]
MIGAALALGGLGAVMVAVAGPGVAAPPGGGAAPGARRATFAVDCAAPGRPISPLVYGIGATDAPAWVWDLGATARRWGGNAASRYNWEHGNAWSTSHDWFFMNVPVSPRPGFGYETFLEEGRAHAVASALTVPMLGWVARDTTSYAFPVSALGPQRATAPDRPDAGDGLRPDGTPLPPQPSRTSVRSTPESVERWVRAIRARDREVGARRVAAYVLDNEPMLWHETHRDVRGDPLGYDELLERTVAYASAIRRADPGATIAGPAAWGWLELQYSAKDRRAGTWLRPDRRRHGDLPLLAWYLRELARAERRTGTRLLDVVDVHFYPANEAIGTSERGGTDPATAALRIRATRSLWDPTYVDESWVAEPMRVIPLVREWIARYRPGLGISVGEWNFGAEGHMSGGLAVAEALGRFGTEGLHSAYYWTHPPLRSPAWWAFRAYRGFDGAGGRFLDRSVPVQGGAALSSLFASVDEGRRRAVLVLLNHDPGSALAARVELAGCGGVSAARAFAYAGGERGFRPADVAAAAGAVEVAAAPYSITVLELSLRGDARPRAAARGAR